MTAAQERVLTRLDANRAKGQRYAAFYGPDLRVARDLVRRGVLEECPVSGVIFRSGERPPPERVFLRG